MNGKLDQLEQQIVAALRRAQGPTPSAELDARVLARAHAAVHQARRTQPRWFGLAAGLVVLVGSGLALRIWQQVERVPGALDRPPTAGTQAVSTAEELAPEPAPETGAGAPAAIDEQLAAPAAAPQARPQATATSEVEGAAATQSRAMDPSADRLGEESAVGGHRPSAVPSERAPPPASEPAPPALSAPAAPGAENLAQPFPGRDLAGMVMQDAAPLPQSPPGAPAGEARSHAPPAPATAPAARTAQVATPPPAPAALPATPYPSAPAELVESKGERQRGAQAKLGAAEDDLARRESVGPADAPAKPTAQVREDFEARIKTLREAHRAGDEDLARRLLSALRQDYPQRALPPDLADWADRIQ